MADKNDDRRGYLAGCCFFVVVVTFITILLIYIDRDIFSSNWPNIIS